MDIPRMVALSLFDSMSGNYLLTNLKQRKMLNIKSYKDFIGCLYTFDSEPTIIESEEDAKLFFNYVDTATSIHEYRKGMIDDEQKAHLSLSCDNDVKKLYTFKSGSYGTFCLKGDYEESKRTIDHEETYEGFDVNVKEDDFNFYIDFNTELGYGVYPKSDWTLENALKDQFEGRM